MVERVQHKTGNDKKKKTLLTLSGGNSVKRHTTFGYGILWPKFVTKRKNPVAWQHCNDTTRDSSDLDNAGGVYSSGVNTEIESCVNGKWSRIKVHTCYGFFFQYSFFLHLPNAYFLGIS